MNEARQKQLLEGILSWLKLGHSNEKNHPAPKSSYQQLKQLFEALKIVADEDELTALDDLLNPTKQKKVLREQELVELLLPPLEERFRLKMEVVSSLRNICKRSTYMTVAEFNELLSKLAPKYRQLGEKIIEEAAELGFIHEGKFNYKAYSDYSLF